MGSDVNQRKVYDFLLRHFETKAPFTMRDLRSLTSWQSQTFATYFSKQLKPFVIETSDGKFRISEGFRAFSKWDRFQKHVTQVRHASSDYRYETYNLVLIYEFFMPLTNENHLRATLETLFFRDTIEARLRTIAPKDLVKRFPRDPDDDNERYINGICDWISDHFGGYSIYHVNGRFRTEPLATKVAAAHLPRYLIDETTAVTRFIFPCKSVIEAEPVEFLFKELFVQAIIEAVNGEDEIWMVETGWKNRLHKWKV